MRKARHDLMGTADLPGVARRAFWWPPWAHPSTRHRHDGRCSRSPLLGQLSSPGRHTQVRMASKSGCGTCFAWSRNDHADPIGEPCGGERQALENGRIAAQAAPPRATPSLAASVGPTDARRRNRDRFGARAPNPPTPPLHTVPYRAVRRELSLQSLPLQPKCCTDSLSSPGFRRLSLPPSLQHPLA
jgi:hypothetical protein